MSAITLVTMTNWAHANLKRPHMTKFAQAYARGMKRDPVNFPAQRTNEEWETEYGLFLDVGGDAEDPL